MGKGGGHCSQTSIRWMVPLPEPTPEPPSRHHFTPSGPPHVLRWLKTTSHHICPQRKEERMHLRGPVDQGHTRPSQSSIQSYGRGHKWGERAKESPGCPAEGVSV